MRKTLLLLTFVSTAIFSSAQIQFGVKAGMNINFIAMDDLPDGIFSGLKPHFGFHAGVYTKLPISEKFFLYPELQYVRKGMRADAGPVLVFHYLELPLIFAWAPADRFTLDAGPGLAYNLATFVGDTQHKIDVEKVDFAINAGVTVNMSDRISIGGRYYHGLVAFAEVIVRDENNVVTHVGKQFNRTVLFSVKYRLK